MKLIEHRDIKNALSLTDTIISQNQFYSKVNLVLYGREHELLAYGGYHPEFLGICIIPTDDSIVLPKIENGVSTLEYFKTNWTTKEIHKGIRMITLPDVNSQSKIQQMQKMQLYDVHETGIPIYVGRGKITGLVRSLMFVPAESQLRGKVMIKNQEKMNELDELAIIWGDKFRYLERTRDRMEKIKHAHPHDGEIEVLARALEKDLQPHYLEKFK